MASSGSVDFTVTRDEIIKGALRAARILGKDATPDPTAISTGGEALNMLVKQWQGKADFAPGLKVWSRKRGYLFLQTGQAVYTLGPTTTELGSTNKWATSYVQTTLSANAAGAAPNVSVSSTTGILNGYKVGIVLNNGSLFWTLVNGAPAGSSVPLATSMPSAASAGNVVFCYFSQARRPLSLISHVLRDINSTDMPVDPMSVEDYEALPSKTTDGDPSRCYYESTLTDGTVYLDREPSDVTKVIRFAFYGAIEDFDVLTDTPDYPQEWFRPLKFQLAIDLWPEYKDGDPPNLLLKLASESLAIAQNTNPETSEAFFEPDR